MTLDVTQRYQDPLTDERFHAWHAALFPIGRSGMTRVVIGDWRNEEAGRRSTSYMLVTRAAS